MEMFSLEMKEALASFGIPVEEYVCEYCSIEASANGCSKCDEYDGIISRNDFITSYGYDFFTE